MLVKVHVKETVYSEYLLDVQASNAGEAKKVCEDNRDDWRNGKSNGAVKIVEPEEVVRAETQSITYEP